VEQGGTAPIKIWVCWGRREREREREPLRGIREWWGGRSEEE